MFTSLIEVKGRAKGGYPASVNKQIKLDFYFCFIVCLEL